MLVNREFIDDSVYSWKFTSWISIIDTAETHVADDER